MTDVTQYPNLPAGITLAGPEIWSAVQAGVLMRWTTDQIATFVAAQYPAPGVTSITAVSPISGGVITATGSIGLETAGVTNTYLATMSAGTVKANVTGSPAQPTDATPSSVLDVIGSTRGQILYRSASAWLTLSPGTDGQVLKTQGAGSDPIWLTIGTMALQDANNVNITGGTWAGGIIGAAYGGTGFDGAAAANGRLPIGNGSGFTLAPLTAGVGITITNSAGGIEIANTISGGTVTSVAVSGGTTGLSTTGGPITAAGTITLTGTLGMANGGTGVDAVATVTDGQLLIGSTGVGFVAASLTAGSGVTITPGAGSIEISSVSSGGTVTSIDVAGGTTGLTFSGGPVTTSGTITMAGVLVGANGGTGVANSGKTITLGGNLVTSGASSITLTSTGATNVTLPTSGTLVNDAVTTLSALTTVGTLTGGATGTGFTIAIGTSTVTGTIPSANVSGSYTGITGVGTLTAGATGAGFTVALGTSSVTGVLGGTNGGTGVNNGSATITLAGDLITSGANSLTFTTTGATNVTLPTSGTLVNTAVTTLSSLTSIGTIGTGVWQGTVVGAAYGGTGVNNGSSTITLAGNLVTSGANSLTLTTTGATNVTLPTSGTLITSAVTTLSSLASIGTITTGVWNGTDIAVADGGTGLSSTTAYGVICGGTTTTGAWQNAGAGSSGQVLTSQGASALPTWAAPSASIVWLATLTASNSATLSDTTNITSTYPNYLIVLQNLVPATDGTFLGIRLAIGGTFQTANYSRSNISLDSDLTTLSGIGSASSDRIYVDAGGPLENTAANGGVSGVLILSNPSGTAHWKRVTGIVSLANSGAASVITPSLFGGAYAGAASAVDGIRFLMDSGNISTGSVIIYGMKNS